MIPQVSLECLQSIVGQEGRDVVGYLTDSIEQFQENQPIMAAVVFNDMENILQQHAQAYNIEDEDISLIELKMKGMFAMPDRDWETTAAIIGWFS